MNSGIKLMLDLSNQECLAGSLNGPALVETLRSLSAEEASSTQTYEGYSAWGVAIHVLYFKYLVAKQLGAPIAYDYEEAEFPGLPTTADAAAWNKLIEEIEAAQKAFIEVMEKASDDDLTATFEAWRMPVGAAATWLISHDISHNAQIRNMGIESLKQKTG